MVLSVGSLEARGGSHGGAHKSSKEYGSSLRLLSGLELTTDQEEQIDALVTVHKENMDTYNEENPKKDLFTAALSETGFDTATFISDSTERFNTIIAMEAEFLAAVIELLTEDQRVELEELITAEPTESAALSYARSRLSR